MYQNMQPEAWPMPPPRKQKVGAREETKRVEARADGLAAEEMHPLDLLRERFATDPSYAHSWHRNLAMAFYDVFPIDSLNTDQRHRFCNEGAALFMERAFGIRMSTNLGDGPVSQDKLSGSEAVYGFAGWLSNRAEEGYVYIRAPSSSNPYLPHDYVTTLRTMFSVTDDASTIAELVTHPDSDKPEGR
ncbi:MAG: hypothetical protein ACR2QC_01405 [Gammaproteobacteria bacterium]